MLALCLVALLAGCSDDTDTKTDLGAPDKGAADNGVTDLKSAGEALPPDSGGSATTKVKLTTSMGDIVLELNAAKAPKTVANFLKYVNGGQYDGTIFHRVINNFMIQGGGYNASYQLKPTHPPITNEAGNGLKNDTGAIAMARTSAPHSATSQFFINVKDNTSLNHTGTTSSAAWGYCVFGKVIAGMSVVNAIKVVKTGAKGPFSKDAPLTNVVITSAKVVP